MDKTQQFALELYEVASAVRDAPHLRVMLGDRKVSVQESSQEADRTIELQILEDDGEAIDFAVFSDGPSGVIGIGGVASLDSVRLDPPKLYVDGVPVRSIDVSPPSR